ncbi:MAG: alkaline phosphatase D family protein [Actinomycetota bacterium]|nr:alkaline phosphatase D family protein [Actinomycetota bacterium]
MPELILGPVVRYVSQTEATVWVETDAACMVTMAIGGERHEARTFCVAQHHYALVAIDGLAPGSRNEYTVALDGRQCWPEPDDPFPHCAIRTLPESGPIRLAFGSCRVSVPHEPPYTLRKDEDDRGREIDAIFALTQRMHGQPVQTWPHVMLWLGDQVYADEVSPATKEFIRGRRDVDEPPGEEVADYEEYAHLYWESWRDPPLRWFLSTVSSSMIWDDHDVHDDWNTSRDWVREMRSEPWWEERITSAVASYWVYQHIGNLSPDELAQDRLWSRVSTTEDAGAMLRRFALAADRESAGGRWSFYRDLNATRLIVMDSRAGRVLDPDGRRMVDDEEWAWIVERARGDFDHLLLATSLPALLAPGMHHLEAWNEAVCEGAWGPRAQVLGERLRQGLDLEHWAAFDDSFDRLVSLLGEVGAGAEGHSPPASIVALSGDVHHAYLADVAFRRGSEVRSSVYQAVCSPLRNPLDSRERRVIKLGMTRGAELAAHALARSAGVEDPAVRWRICDGPWFDNQVAGLEIDGRAMTLRLEKARLGEGGRIELEQVLERRLA